MIYPSGAGGRRAGRTIQRRPRHDRHGGQRRLTPIGGSATQTIFVTEGIGPCQREGGPVEVIRPGDRVFFEPGEHHWHGAAPTRFMVHLAMHQHDGSGRPATWGEHVTAEQYAAAPPTGD